MAIVCLGCSAGHASDAAILFGEARKFEAQGKRDLADLHLAKAMGALREAEEQCPIPELREELRGIRKLVEGTVAAGGGIPEVERRLLETAAKLYGELRRRPELCVTCRVDLGGEFEH